MRVCESVRRPLSVLYRALLGKLHVGKGEEQTGTSLICAIALQQECCFGLGHSCNHRRSSATELESGLQKAYEDVGTFHTCRRV